MVPIKMLYQLHQLIQTLLLQKSTDTSKSLAKPDGSAAKPDKLYYSEGFLFTRISNKYFCITNVTTNMNLLKEINSKYWIHQKFRK